MENDNFTRSDIVNLLSDIRDSIKDATREISRTNQEISRTNQEISHTHQEIVRTHQENEKDYYSKLQESDEKREANEERHRLAMDKIEKDHKKVMEEIEEKRRADEERHRIAMDGYARRHEEMINQIKIDRDEYRKEMKEINKRIDDQGFVQGEVAEDLFRRNITQLLADTGFKVDRVLTNIKGLNDREYDIVALNGSEMFVFEIKNKLKEKDIDKFLDKQIPDFKDAFPKYSHFKIYGGMGSLVVKREVENTVKRKGLLLLTQGENGSAHLAKPARLQSW